MNTVCQVDKDDECSLHSEFSDRITKAHKHSVTVLMKYVLQRGNPFNLEQTKGIMNIGSGEILEKDEEDFLMNCSSLGKAARNELYELRLKEKNIHTAQKMKFFIKDFLSKCDQIRRKLRIWSHLLKKSLMENSIFLAVTVVGNHS